MVEKKKKGRAIRFTCSETAMIFYMVGFIVAIKACVDLVDLHAQALALNNPGLASTFVVIIFFIGFSLFFSFLAFAFTNYQISKYNLNLMIDRISNPNFIGWIEINRNKRIKFQVVETGAMGRTKGLMDNNLADVINDGSCTVTTPCGNQAILVSDFLSTNLNLDRIMGKILIKKHFGVIGFNAWGWAAKHGKVKLSVKEKKQHKNDEKKTAEAVSHG